MIVYASSGDPRSLAAGLSGAKGCKAMIHTVGHQRLNLNGASALRRNLASTRLSFNTLQL